MRRKPGYTAHLCAALVLTMLCTATSDAARGRRASIAQAPGDWDAEATCDLSESQDGENCREFQLPVDPSPPDPVINGDMVLQIGNRRFTHVWFNSNGFLSLGEGADPTPATYEAGVDELRGVSGDIIAPFYAPIQIRPVEANNGFCPDECIWDLTFSQTNVRDPENPAEDVIGFRATWGLFPRRERTPNPDEPPVEDRQPGVARSGAAIPANRNTFQIWLIDREPTTGRSGDFDIHFNYSGITWELADRTFVGIKVGPANNPEVLLDFAKFYGSFLDENDDISAEKAAECAAGSEDRANSDPFFDKAWALGCNTITVEFRDGVPNLKTYTADLSVSLTSDANQGTPHATVAHQMTLAVSNVNYDKATNVLTRITLPADVTLTSSPATACTQNGTIAECLIDEIAANANASVALSIRTNQSGDRSIGVEVAADQFDPMLANNIPTPVVVDFEDTADVSIVNCARPASVREGNSATVNCTVRNDGPQAASNVRVRATLPANITFTSGAGCSVAGNVLTCTAASLASQATVDLSATFNAVSAGNAAITVELLSDTFDPMPNANVSASFNITEPPEPERQSGGGRISLETLLALLCFVAFVARRRLRALRQSTPSIDRIENSH